MVDLYLQINNAIKSAVDVAMAEQMAFFQSQLQSQFPNIQLQTMPTPPPTQPTNVYSSGASTSRPTPLVQPAAAPQENPFLSPPRRQRPIPRKELALAYRKSKKKFHSPPPPPP